MRRCRRPTSSHAYPPARMACLPCKLRITARHTVTAPAHRPLVAHGPASFPRRLIAPAVLIALIAAVWASGLGDRVPVLVWPRPSPGDIDATGSRPTLRSCRRACSSLIYVTSVHHVPAAGGTADHDWQGLLFGAAAGGALAAAPVSATDRARCCCS